jgi:predicted transcriptional regulator
MRRIMNNLSSSVNNNYNKNNGNNALEWRRNKVQELASQGYNQSEISRILQISQPTINRDLTYLRQQAKNNIKRYIDERLPEEYEKCLVGLNMIKKRSMDFSTKYKRQQRENSSIIFGKGMSFYGT